MDRVEQAPPAHVAAAVLMLVKAVLGLWAAIVLFSASASEPRTFLGQAIRRRAGGLGFFVLVLVIATGAVAVALLTAQQWAPPAAYVLEGLAAVLAVLRIGARPGAATLSIAMSALIIGLVAVGSSPARTRMVS